MPNIQEPGRGAAASPRRDQGSAEAEGRILSRVREDVGPESFQRYFDQRTRVRLTPEEVEVAVPTRFVAQLMDRRFAESLRRAAMDELGATDSVRVRFEVDDRLMEPKAASAPPRRRAVSPDPIPAEIQTRFQLEDLVVGDCNRLAIDAASRIADPRADAPSPLFIHGPCGVGKTHTLHGIAVRFLAARPAGRVRYVTAEAFTNEFLAAMRTNAREAFRRAYRGVDLLCVDDVHYLSNKHATQSELQHTFDAVDLSGSRVVLASDEHPRRLARFNAGLASRLMGGMVVSMDPPGPDVRAAIVRRVAARRGLELDEGAVSFLVGHCRSGPEVSTVRELQGMVLRVDAYARLSGRGPQPGTSAGRVRVTVGDARGALGADSQSAASAATRRAIRVEWIEREVCEALSVTQDEVRGRGRRDQVVLARGLISLLSRRLTDLSYPDIARAAGRRNHSSIITAEDRLSRLIEGGQCVRFQGDTITIESLAVRIADRVARAAARG